MATSTTLTPASHSLFMEFAGDAGNWNGSPMVAITPAQRGNLTDLKTHGLLTTFTDEGITWVNFTDAGLAYAAQFGVTIRPPL